MSPPATRQENVSQKLGFCDISLDAPADAEKTQKDFTTVAQRLSHRTVKL
jgi:hypothetical protein